MHKKLLLFILVCMLMLPSTFALANNPNNNFGISKNSSNIPKWSVGDSWTYNMEISPSSDAMMTLDGSLENLKMTVVSDTGSTYEIDLEGEISGKMIVNVGETEISGNIRDGTIDGSMVVDSSNLGTKNMEIEINGKIVIALIPVFLSVDLSITFTPTYNMIDFPLSVGKTWTVTNSDVSINGIIKIGNNIEEEFNSDTFVGGGNAEVKQIKTVNVESGSYEAYEIESDQELDTIYYASDAGNIIKTSGNSFYYFDFIEATLISTTYSPVDPESPNTPSKPNGPRSGKPDVTYEFSSSTTDNQGDQIYYMFSWGDSNSVWLGPYESGETCKKSHSWSSNDNYEIKVKAKDDKGYESDWSDPLIISISNSKFRSNFFMFFEYLINEIPIIKIVLSIFN